MTVAVLSSTPSNQKFVGISITNIKSESELAVSDVGSFYSADEEEGVQADEQGKQSSDDDNNPDDNVTLKTVLANWSGNTSVHGIAWMVDEGSNALWHRLLWALFTLAGAGVMIWQIQALVRDYRKYEVETSSVVKWPKELNFPDITVCNLNRFQSSYILSNDLVEPKTLQQIDEATQHLDGFILETYFNSERIENQSSVWHEHLTTFGKCFTFRTDQRATVPGIDAGLQFFANIDLSEYLFWTPYAGVRVFVTDRGAPINHQVPFVAAKPGRKAYVNIQTTFYDRVEERPWSRCNSGPIPPVVCHMHCIEALIRKNCSCQVWGEFEQEPPDPNKPPLDYCVEDIKVQCGDKINLTAADEECNPHCLPACTEWRYQTTVSDFEYAAPFLEALSNGYNFTTEFFTNNIMDISVNFETISYEEQTENKAISYNELLASIGGSMGLFLGVSVLSFVELSDLIFLRVIPRMFGVRHLFGIGGKNFQRVKKQR